ncbi:hypothetical protein I633_15155 [Alteromonas mediterranea 615]|uniref:Orc1-like AAA ATPase domain-containing protein n=1 Tax=Alteromonas mediterranea 615 TaxID=1300253 RepID=S5APK5_9ALTE|nr:hypothetical protein I633_15155 [Alteromonas mediterranea 615]
MNLSEFKKIKFGYASAEKENAADQSLLAGGFLNFKNIAGAIKDGSEFLVLGDKGAGKTAVATHLHLMAKEDPLLFVKRVSLADLPFSSFANIVKGKDEPETKYPTAWTWIFLLMLIDSLSSDEGMETDNASEFHNFHKLLKNNGLAPSEDIPAIVRKSSKKSFSLNLKGIFSYNEELPGDLDMASVPELVDSMKQLLSKCRTKSKHLIIFDGLDDILTKRNAQYDVLGALIFECSRLNSWFNQTGLPTKIIVLCRVDLFQKISGANKNKIRQNFSVELDWYQHPSDPGNSILFDLLNHRAAQSLDEPHSILKFLNDQPKVGPQEAKHYLLSYTRHRPRDIIVLLSTLQQKVISLPIGPTVFHSAARTFAQNYFVGEISDELYGFLDQQKIEATFEALSQMKLKEFTFSQANAIFKEYLGDETDVVAILKRLYECGAVGNGYTSPAGRKSYNFKFSHPHSTFSSSHSIKVHNGLASALNLLVN